MWLQITILYARVYHWEHKLMTKWQKMKLLQEYLFISLWDLNMTLFNILRRFLQKNFVWTFSEVPLYNRIFPNNWVCKKIYEKQNHKNLSKIIYLKATNLKLAFTAHWAIKIEQIAVIGSFQFTIFCYDLVKKWKIPFLLAELNFPECATKLSIFLFTMMLKILEIHNK
jgi:hypothetical protein